MKLAYDMQRLSSNLLFTSFDQFQTGLLWSSQRLTDMETYERLWLNDATTRLPDIKTRFNVYRTTTEFWESGLWGRAPRNMSEDVAKVFEQASVWRSMKGNGIVLVDADNRIRAVDPSDWHPVYDEADADSVVGHIVTYFYNAHRAADSSEQPDRVDVLMIPSDGGGTRQTFTFEGQSVGTPASEPMQMAVKRIAWWGDGVSDYVDAKPIVDELEARYSALARVLDQHSDPHLQGPESALDADGVFRPAEGSNFLPLPDTESPEFAYVTYDGKQEAQLDAINQLFDQLQITTKIPATAFGLSTDAQQSGVSRERLLFAAIQKLRRLRREMTGPVMDISAELGSGMESVEWPNHPFSSWGELAETLAICVKEGIYSAEQAREMLEF